MVGWLSTLRRRGTSAWGVSPVLGCGYGGAKWWLPVPFLVASVTCTPLARCRCQFLAGGGDLARGSFHFQLRSNTAEPTTTTTTFPQRPCCLSVLLRRPNPPCRSGVSGALALGGGGTTEARIVYIYLRALFPPRSPVPRLPGLFSYALSIDPHRELRLLPPPAVSEPPNADILRQNTRTSQPEKRRYFHNGGPS